jgi:NAD(P)-dependent dehydrogenase (short-subunit alcohol dehydrogenase family)
MTRRLAEKVALVIGGGQTEGDTIGNGRASALLYAREGARVLVADLRPESALETVAEIEAEGGTALALDGDATDEAVCRGWIETAVTRFDRIDVLHNNVGIGEDDRGPAHVDEAAWDRVLAVNLKSMVFPCKHILPVMREQGAGSIINISSIAAICSTPLVAYKTSKAGINAYTQSLAVGNAKYGIRANVIMPGLMNTPMAIEGISRATGVEKSTLIAQRDARVPLGAKMGSAWDVAYAALFLASDEARFITGVMLPVDGGQSARRG